MIREKLRNFLNSIKFKLIVIFIVIFLVPFTFVETIVYRNIESQTIKNINELMQNNLTLVSDYTSSILNDIQTDFRTLSLPKD